MGGSKRNSGSRVMVRSYWGPSEANMAVSGWEEAGFGNVGFGKVVGSGQSKAEAAVSGRSRRRLECHVFRTDMARYKMISWLKR